MRIVDSVKYETKPQIYADKRGGNVDSECRQAA
jgi:hypothetical protein